MFVFGSYPKDTKLCADIEKTLRLFQNKAETVVPKALPISAYNQRYLSEHLSRLFSLMKRIGFFLAWVIKDSQRPYKDLVLVEYGAGTGLPCCVAKLLGIGTVIYSDHFAPSCEDAKAIHHAFGTEADAYVCGELEEIIEYLKSKQLACDALISSDCIEHIYDVDKFLMLHKDIPGNRLTVAHSSGANSKNPFRVRQLKKYHIQREYLGFQVKEGHKPTELGESYLEVRRRLIREYAPDLSVDIIDKLATHTRGMRKEDIYAAVDTFRKMATLPPLPAHPTNTCDPLNGNWAEHLLDFHHLVEVMNAAGFSAQIVPGYYAGTTPLRRLVLPMLNLAIRAAGPWGIHLGHFFMLYGQRKID